MHLRRSMRSEQKKHGPSLAVGGELGEQQGDIEKQSRQPAAHILVRVFYKGDSVLQL